MFRFVLDQRVLVLVWLMLVAVADLFTARIVEGQSGPPTHQSIVQAINDLQASVNSLQAGVNHCARRKYYLTQTLHNGSQALTACAPSFHMASLWEIRDPSNLKYDLTLGLTLADSGSGPPLAFDLIPGWVRTGGPAAGTGVVGEGNCIAWSSNSNAHSGTAIRLLGMTFGEPPFPEEWTDPTLTRPIGPWFAFAHTCADTFRVWCMEDD